MKKFKLKNTATSTTVGVYSTKAEAIKAMDCLIFKTNSENGQTEEEGLSPFDFTLEITEVDVADVINSIDEARKYLNLIPNTNLKVHDFHYDTRQYETQSSVFRHFPDHKWQPILFWWTGMTHTLSRRYPHVFKVQKLNRKEQPSTPLEIYTATIATMQKYASLTEDQVNNQSYSLVLEHLERLSKENEEMEKIRKK